MRLDLNLSPKTSHFQPLRFGWDSETGTLWGEHAAQVAEMIDTATGGTLSLLAGTGFQVDATDIVHEPLQMAALLGSFWRLPPELQALLPDFSREPHDPRVRF